MSTKRSAFTLIELLVVISIISVLISILLPSLSAARQRGKATVCGNNLRQLGVALANYQDDNDGYYPGHHLSAPFGWVVWPPRIRKYAGNQAKPFNCPSAESYFHWKIERRGFAPAMYGYGRGEVRITWTTGFSYGYNDWGVEEGTVPHLGLGAVVDNQAHDLWNEAKVSEIAVPSDMITLADSKSDFVWDTAIDPISDGVSEQPSKRHFGGSEVLFSDGHVEWYKLSRLIDNSARTRAKWNSDHKPHFGL